MNLVPWKRKKGENRGDSLATRQDFPMAIRRMRDELNDLFEQFSEGFSVWEPTFGKGWNWGVDIVDKDDHVEIHAEAPGFEAGDFDVRVTGNRLVMRATHNCEHQKDKDGGEFREQHECFESVMLPEGIDASKVEASYHNGMLTVTIPKTSEGKGQRITVKSGADKPDFDKSGFDKAGAEKTSADKANSSKAAPEMKSGK